MAGANCDALEEKDVMVDKPRTRAPDAARPLTQRRPITVARTG
jgi:hypothetical protein